MSKFIVTLDGGTIDQRNAVTNIFLKKEWRIWHWMEDLWLLSEVPDEVTAQAISEEIYAHPVLKEKVKSVVIRIPDSAVLTYWGRGSKKGWDWMAQFWGKPG